MAVERGFNVTDSSAISTPKRDGLSSHRLRVMRLITSKLAGRRVSRGLRVDGHAMSGRVDGVLAGATANGQITLFH